LRTVGICIPICIRIFLLDGGIVICLFLLKEEDSGTCVRGGDEVIVAGDATRCHLGCCITAVS